MHTTFGPFEVCVESTQNALRFTPDAFLPGWNRIDEKTPPPIGYSGNEGRTL